jgi:ferritin
MKKIKNKLLLTSFLILVITFCSSAAIAKTQDNGKVNGAEHRSAVSTFVQKLSDVADKEQNGIGEQVRTVAKEQNENKDRVADAIDKVQNRNKVKTFLIGTDYKNIGQLRSEMVKTGNQIDRLKRLIDKTINTESKTVLRAQLQALTQEQQKINDFLKANESKFSIFGWFVKLFNK